jgi:hypothetical protein
LGVQGTSLSCPILAGMLATINSERIRKSKKALTRQQILTNLYNIHPPNSPVDLMTDGIGFINNRFVEYLISL